MPRRGPRAGLPEPLPGTAPCPACWWVGEAGAALLIDSDTDPRYRCLACGHEADPVWLLGDPRYHLAWDDELAAALERRTDADREVLEVLVQCVTGGRIPPTEGGL